MVRPRPLQVDGSGRKIREENEGGVVQVLNIVTRVGDSRLAAIPWPE